MINWTKEEPLIRAWATHYAVDYAFIMAIRHTENGGPGREFGVLSTAAPTYLDQLKIACHSVANALVRYGENPYEFNNHDRKCYTMYFVGTFASHWAPRSAENDPEALNANWYDNCLATYRKLCEVV